jgi:hypothetical protein
MLKIIKALYILINVVIIIALLAIHFIFKENSYDSSLLYYTFPLPILIIIILFLSIFLGKKTQKYNLILAGLLLIVWLGRSFKIHIPEGVNETDLEIVIWNASRDNDINDAIIEIESTPDVLVLVESKERDISELQIKYPNYYFYSAIREIYIFSKTPISIINEESSKFKSTVVNFQTAGINFYAIDIMGSTDVPREWGYKFLTPLIQKKNNTVLLGDFNVPYESKFLDTFKTDFNHAFNKKGNGFRETWIWNIPLLSLDHIWVSKDLEVLKTQKINTFKSDHAMIKTVLRK